MSKRTIILIVAAVIAFLAAIGSLYFEKKQVIKDIEEPEVEEPEPEKEKDKPIDLDEPGK